MPSNAERAGRFAGLLPYYPDDEHTNTIDLLADCLHWCNEHRYDFDDLLRVARGHFTAERAEEADVTPSKRAAAGPTGAKAGSGVQRNDAQEELVAALNYLLEQTVDMDLKYGTALSEGEVEAREQALVALAQARAVTASPAIPAAFREAVSDVLDDPEPERPSAGRAADPGKKLFTVQIEELSRMRQVLQVQAENQEEAQAVAEENFLPNWSESISEGREVTLLTENGVPVEWSPEASERDPQNPYRPKEMLPEQHADPDPEPDSGPDFEP
jgi:hypothetical protein